MQHVRGDACCGVATEMLPERQVYPGIKQLARERRRTAESVYNPCDGRSHSAMYGEQFGPSAHTVYDKRFAHLLGEKGVAAEKLCLQLHVRTA